MMNYHRQRTDQKPVCFSFIYLFIFAVFFPVFYQPDITLTSMALLCLSGTSVIVQKPPLRSIMTESVTNFNPLYALFIPFVLRLS